MSTIMTLTLVIGHWSELPPKCIYIHLELSPSLTGSPDVTHHDVDKGVLDEREEDEEGAGGHEHVNCLMKK